MDEDSKNQELGVRSWELECFGSAGASKFQIPDSKFEVPNSRF
jgi:hypothetical protein